LSFPYLQNFLGLGSGLQTKNAAGGGVGVGGWVELGRTTLGASSDTITVSSLTNKRYYMILGSTYATGGQIRQMLRFNSDTGNNYAYRGGADGGSVTSAPRSNMPINEDNEDVGEFSVGYVSNFATKEKLVLGHSVRVNATGAGTAPGRTEFANKHSQTSNPINAMNFVNPESGDYASGSELVVLGWDPADTHTNNFWTELANVTLNSSSNTLSSGTITAKKYLWVQAYLKSSGSTNRILRFNSDSGSNYTMRLNANGGTDSGYTAFSGAWGGEQGNSSSPMFLNFFIVNTASKEKLVIGNELIQNTAGAGTAPKRTEGVGKWTNTSNQITQVSLFNNDVTDYASGSSIVVWGSD
jgi:hypothetical protein